jgi:hypothetical protein
LLIPGLVLVSFPFVARRKRIFSPGGTFGCAGIAKRGGIPTHYTMRSYDPIKKRTTDARLKPWLIETSEDWQCWQEVEKRENNHELNGLNLTRPFAVTAHRLCCFIGLVSVVRNH